MKTEKVENNIYPTTDRIKSVDFFRGFTMFLLMGESTGLYKHIGTFESKSMQFISTQLSHPAWTGMTCWDLIQPFFMFIVGVTIPASVLNRQKKGDTKNMITKHAIKRSLILLICGWALYCIDAGKIVFRFQNVLSQLSITYLVAFLIWNKKTTFQIAFTISILILVDLAYRFFPIEGFNQPWERYHNLGSWLNNKIEGVDKTSSWATLNAIPTIAHTVWGALCGALLISNKAVKHKIRILLFSGFMGLLVGYSLDIFNITPVIKKIATSSFVFVSGGWTILAFCFCYWLIDIKKIFTKGANFFIIVGMNCIFIYLFFSAGGSDLLRKIFIPFIDALFSGGGSLCVKIVTDFIVWLFMWYMCFWLYQKRIFIKI